MAVHDVARWLTVPGINGSGPDHWQSRWEATRSDCQRIDLGNWSNPQRNHWVTKLDLAIAQESRPVLLIAHSLGCFAVAWWAALAEAGRLQQVVAAVLVAPPDVERGNVHPAIARFAPVPRVIFPFSSLVIASSDDPYAALDRSRFFARRWGSAFEDAGALGHINAKSALGDWVHGQALASRLLSNTHVSAASPLRSLIPPTSHDRSGPWPDGGCDARI